MRTTVLCVVPLLLVAVSSGPARAQSDVRAAVAGLEFREIGPAIMGGRISDIAVVEPKPQIFYVGTASGGLFKTVNHGTSWVPLFDEQPTASIGDVTLAPSNPNVIWVGTGEPQNRQSSPWGNGVYRSTDAGRTWKHVGLEATHHIGRIVVHPTDPAVAYVAAVGRLWGANPERGVYKTTDGGATWELVLFVDEHTGAIDLVMDPGDPQTLFAAMYQRRRTGYGFNGGGPGSGIYRTYDGGSTWQQLTNGLPEGDKGRIGLDVFHRDGSLIYALIEADARDPARGFGDAPSGTGRPAQSGLYRSVDRGDTWERVSSTNPRPMYYSQVRIDPNDPERIYVLGTDLMISEDGGKTFRDNGAETIHVDHHALWIDPADSDHLIIGNDGGVAASFDRAATWRMYDNLAIGQFYQIGVDMRDPYYVCGGLQDNSSWCGPSRTLSMYGVRNGDWYDVSGGDGFFNVIDPTDHTIVYTESQGGNVSRVDITTGEAKRIRPVARPTGEGEAEEDERSYRWNWNTPIVISAHDPATIYLGANHLMRSRDRGHSWEEASPDLTKQIDRTQLEIMGVKGSEPMMSPNDGISSYGNITAIGESPINPRLVYVGTDDGNVQLTRDGGTNWTDITSRIRGLPERTYVSRLVPSRIVEGRVYATFDGHRNNDFAPYVFVSEDYGSGWRRITSGLPEGWSVNVIVEHHRNPNLLFLGNEIGLYMSVDRGESWVRLKNNLPTVPVDDIVIHPRDNDLIVGTHGRSIWILRDIAPLEALTADLLSSPVHLFAVAGATMHSFAGGWPFGGANYAAENPPRGVPIRYYLAEKLGGDDAEVTIEIVDAAGGMVRTLKGTTDAGIHELVWDFRLAPPYEPAESEEGGFGGTPEGPRVLPGRYTARLVAGESSAERSFDVFGEPRVEASQGDLRARQDALMSLHVLNGSLAEASRATERLSQQVADVRELLEGSVEVADSVSDAAEQLSDDLEDLRRELSQVRRDARLSGSIEGTTSRPTADEEWQIERTWQRAPALIDRLNAIMEVRLPAIYEMLNRLGVRPAVGDPVVVPRRP